MIDPISTAASIIAFIDAIAKIKGTIDKVGQNNGRFAQVKKEVIRGLKDIEIFCRHRHTSLNEADTKELKKGVDDLRKDLLQVCAGIQKHKSRKAPTNVMSAAKSNTQAWLLRRNLEHDITRLEKRIQDCQIRFLSFTSARTEHRIITHHRENTHRMNHLDGMLSDILVPQQIPQFVENPNPVQKSKSPFGALKFFDLLGGQLESSNKRYKFPTKRPHGPASPLDLGFPFDFPMFPANIANQSCFGGEAQMDDRPIALTAKQALYGFAVAAANVLCYLITLLWCTDLRSAFAWLIDMSSKVYEACKREQHQTSLLADSTLIQLASSINPSNSRTSPSYVSWASFTRCGHGFTPGSIPVLPGTNNFRARDLTFVPVRRYVWITKHCKARFASHHDSAIDARP